MQIYILFHIVCALFLGALFLNFKKIFKFSYFSLFFMGIALTPLYIGLVSFLLGVFFAGAPSFIHILIPILILLILLLCKKNYLKFFKFLIYIKFKIKNAFKRENIASQKIKYFVNLTVTLLLIVFLLMLGKNMYQKLEIPFVGHDVTHYALQARYFAEDTKSIEIDNYNNERFGTVFPDDHGPLWVTYLGQSLMFDSQGYLGYPYDITARFAVLITFIYMLFAIGAVCLAIKKDIKMFAVSVFIFMMWSYIDGLFSGHSRDFFKMITILFFIYMLMAIILRSFKAKNKKKVFYIRDYIIIVFASFLLIQGHGGNLFLALGMAMALLIMLICLKLSFNQIVKVLLCGIIGISLGFIKNIMLYINTGMFRSYTTVYTTGLNYAISPSITHSFKEKLQILSEGQSFFIIIIALIATTFILCEFFINKKHNNSISVFYTSKKALIFLVITAFSFISLTGLMNLPGYDISSWYYLNFRYRIHVYVFLAIVGGYFISILMDSSSRSKLSIVAGFIALGITFVLGANAINTVGNKWISNNEPYVKWTNEIVKMKDAVQASVKNGTILTNYDRYTYYFDKNVPYVLPGPAVVEVLTAKNENNLKKAMENINLKCIIITPNSEESEILASYLYEYVKSNTKKVEYLINKEPVEVYYL